MDIDEIDRQILQVLEEDPRISNRKISEIVKLTPQAVGIRIKKLRNARVIGGIKILKPLPKPSKIVRKIKRFKTNIAGLDRHIGGGFPIPSTVLLLGESGSGTSIFCLKLLWTALNEGLRCAFFALERPKEQVIQQMQSFGWDPTKLENVHFIDVYNVINQYVKEFESISHMDILQVYREMIEQQKNLMPDTEIVFFDSFTALIKLVKGSPIEIELVNQLGTNIIKTKSDQTCFFTMKPHILSEDALLTLKSYADCVIQLRKEVEHRQLHRFLLIEKMLMTDHTVSEIQFHIDNQGILLNEYMLQYLALQNPTSSQKAALFRVKELDYLTQGLMFGTSWLLEIDSLFPLSDLLKLYTDFLIDGLAREKACRFAFPKIALTQLLKIFKQSIKINKELQKSETTLIDLITQNRLILYDIFQKSSMLEDEDDATYFERIEWSHNPEKNLAKLGTLFTNPTSKNTYSGLIVSDLLSIRLTEDQILWLYDYLLRVLQKQGDILLATVNTSLHSPEFLNKLEYNSDGIIRLGVSPPDKYGQDKYIQIVKAPNGNPSASHLVQSSDKPPYFQII